MKKFTTQGKSYDIRQVDLGVKPQNVSEKMKYLYSLTTVDGGDGYLGHPDSVLLKNGAILTAYPAGHGKGAVLMSESTDGGNSYFKKDNLPKSFEDSRETPTIYRLNFKNGSTKLVLFSACPKWGAEKTTGGFNVSFSNNEGENWSEFKLFYPKDEKNGVVPIVAMSSLVRLKENGEFVDKWMGLFHDKKFHNYKTILSFDEDENAVFSVPEMYFSAFRKAEKKTQMCEVLLIRNDNGKGDKLMIITRSNSKKCNSLISVSTDEGKTWSQPKEAPSAINGERHKAVYANDGRLFITFRSIERDKEKLSKYKEKNRKYNWYSEGWIAWVGTFEDLENGRQGQYRIKIAHTYLSYQSKPEVTANGDTAYCGNVVLPDGTIVTCSYGIFDVTEKDSGTYKTDKGRMKRKTYIASKRIRLADTDELAKA